MYIYRFNSNGSLDNSFGVSGRTQLDFQLYFPEDGNTYKQLVIQPDNKIIVVGTDNGYSKFAIRRFNANGSTDNTFNSGAILVGDYRGIPGNVTAVALQNDGKIVIAGMADEKIGIRRFMPDGSTDSSFNGNGVKLIDEIAGISSPSGIYCQADNKIVITGTVNYSNLNMLVVKLNTNGSLDPSFGTSGYSIIPKFGWDDVSFGMAPQSTGNILIYGYVTLGPGNFDMAIYRINNSIITSTGNTFTELTNIVAAPNPVTSKLQISSNQIKSGKYTITVRTIDGRQLFSETITTTGNRLQYTCDAAAWPSGVLFVDIRGQGQFKTFRIVKAGN
jgi:uncharacterized delta-60 repeat protein